ncbi:hypothetical protein PanWU01x14_275760, partial [Parasponia andersonii]
MAAKSMEKIQFLLTPHPDRLIWRDVRNGNFSTKTTYWSLIKYHIQEVDPIWKSIFPIITTPTKPNFVLPNLSSDIIDSWNQLLPSYTNTPSHQPDPIEPLDTPESGSSSQNPEQIETLETNKFISLSHNCTTTPPSNSLTPSIPPMRQSTHLKHPSAWHKDYVLSVLVNHPSSIPSSTS